MQKRFIAGIRWAVVLQFIPAMKRRMYFSISLHPQMQKDYPKKIKNSKCSLITNMKLLLYRLLFPLLLIVSLNSKAQHSKLNASSAPAWATINEIDYNNQKLEAEAEDGLLNLRVERQVSLPDQSLYYRRTIKILSEAGVQNGSEISVNFDPVYEQLTFNSVLIIRDGKQIDKLQRSKFKTIQQEK